VTTRGDNMMTIFEDKGDNLQQKLAFKVGNWPRHFAITDYGVIYVAAQKENKVYRYLMKEEKILQIG
jgi:6-phosphogluconolactonase (cycloisomerase 2 family)